MRVLAMTAWYPTEAEPHLGAYVVEHMLATAKHCRIDLIHARVDRSWTRPGGTVRSEAIGPNCTVHQLDLRLLVRRFGEYDRRLGRTLEMLARDLQKTGPPFDLVHVNVRDHNTKLMAPIAQRMGLPLVHSEHWSFYHRGFAALSPKERERVRAEMQAWMSHPNLKLVLPVSNELGDHLKRSFSAPPHKMFKVPNVAGREFRPGDGRPPGDRFRIALAAAWHEPKNPVVFAEALALLPEKTLARLEIDWVGDGPELQPARERMEAAAPRLCVRFHGMKPKSFVAEKMRDAHLFVHPTDAENLPTVIIESLCCGTPVLSHAVNGVPELLHEGNGALCPPGDAPALAARLGQIVEGPYPFDRARISREALALYSADAVGAQLQEMYERAVAAA